MATRRAFFITTALFIMLFASPPCQAASEVVTRTGKDSVTMSAVVPGTGAYILTPSKFHYALNFSYSLNSCPEAHIVLNVYSFGAHGARERIASSARLAIKKGDGGSSLLSTTILVKKAPSPPQKILLVLSMVTPAGRELAFASSVNYLQGNVYAEYKENMVSRDYMQILSVNPAPGTLIETGIKRPFALKIAYNIYTVGLGYVVIKYCAMPSSFCWREFFVPIEKGRGTLTVDIPPVNLPAARRGDTLGLVIPFFTDLTSGTPLSTDQLWPYSISR
ncbi:MAG: hypothetical protein RDV48_29780 [Candidatus Eremiobacteraeota bacterium]|nr:hypothetical protein [Candidatus Eremiobacteraeota bacterium]